MNGPVYVNNKLVGYVSEKISNSSTGEQSYVITDTNPLTTPPSAATSVTVIYQGSQDATDWENNIPLALGNLKQHSNSRVLPQILNGSDNMPMPQLTSSAATLNRVLDDYPNAMVDVYGQSLGSMDGQYAVANIKDPDRLRNAYLYEGPNMYSTLNAEQKKNLAKIQNRVFNYLDFKDPVTMEMLGGYQFGDPAIGIVCQVDSTWGTGLVDQHMWGGYQYNPDGSIKSDTITIEKTRLGQVLGLAAQWKQANGGKLSASQQVMVDGLAAQAVGTAIKDLQTEHLGGLKTTLTTAMETNEDAWSASLDSAQQTAPDLSDTERLDALETMGVTRDSIVTTPNAKYDQALVELDNVNNDFTDITDKIDTLTSKMQRADATAKALLESWGIGK